MTDNSLDRRSLFKLGLGVASLGVGAIMLEMFGARETGAQKSARAVLEDNSIPKPNWKVKLDPDIEKYNGVAVRPFPKAPLPGEGDHILTKLKPGESIAGVVWKGRDIKTQREDTPSWVAFMFKEKPEDRDLTVGFVSLDYLSQKFN